MNGMLFSELNLSDEIRAAISSMGFEKATPVQEKSIAPMIDGRDLVAQAPTGTGKTCAFGIPLVECTKPESEHVSALVLCPTRELCMQTADELTKLSKFKKNIKVAAVYGGQDFSRQLFALKRRPQIVVATPGRLMDHMRRRTINLENLSFMVLDEADEMLNMGFREDIDTILQSVPSTRQTALFSATLSPEIMAITKKYQNDAVSVKVERKGRSAASIEQYYITVPGVQKLEALTRMIDVKGYKSSMVFCNTKRMVDALAEHLIAQGYRADCIHGDMKQAQRDKVMAKFKSHGIDILVATDVAARGIDVDNIEAIFNFDLPAEDEYYIHRIGRTGRADKTGVAYSFVMPKQMGRLKQLMRYAACTVLPHPVPTKADVENAKTDKLFERIKEVAALAGHADYTASLTRYLSENGGGLSALDVAAAFMRLADVKPMRVAEAPAEKVSVREPAEHVRMFINVGTLDKMNRRSMLDLFKVFTDIDVRQISEIDIFDKYSFVNIPSGDVEHVIRSLSEARYKGRAVSIEIAQRSDRRCAKRSNRFAKSRRR
ncbi:MAG: DEAD/DEAH box helicase [Clostridia bacterium]|nr:DEAD/DEAH box helicase [Clostridia bacterium]